MATQTTTFSDAGNGATFSVEHGKAIDYSLALASGTTFDGTFKLMRTQGLGTWEQVLRKTEAVSGRYICEHPGRSAMLYRWTCSQFGEGADPVAAVISDVNDVVQSFADGALEIYEDGSVVTEGVVIVGGTLAVTGTSTLTGAVTASSSVKIAGVVASSVTKVILNGSGNALLATCATANIPTGTGYAKGCLLIATDGTDQTNTLFANIGSATTANFNAVTVAAD
jgi:hypothetical protein